MYKKLDIQKFVNDLNIRGVPVKIEIVGKSWKKRKYKVSFLIDPR